MKRIVLALLVLSASVFAVQFARAPKGSTLPHLSQDVRVCDYRYFIKKCLVEKQPYRPTEMYAHDACYPAIAYCLVRLFPQTRHGERIYVCCLFAVLALCLALLLGRECRFRSLLFLPVLCLTSAVASGPLRGNPSAWSGAAVFVFLIWYDSEIRWRRFVAAVALAFAASLKISPAVFGLLYLRGRLLEPARWPVREIGVAVVGFAVFLILPFSLFGGLGEIGSWWRNAIANSDWYGQVAVYGFMGVFDTLVGHGILPFEAWPLARALTMMSAVVFLSVSLMARTRYLAVLLIGAAMAFLCHHDYGLVYLVPAFVLWLADEADRVNETQSGRVFQLLDAVLWLLILTPLWYSFNMRVMSAGIRFQNEALIVLGFSAVIRVMLWWRGRHHPECRLSA